MNYYIKIFLEFIRNPSKALKIVRNRIRVSLGIYVRHDKKIIDSIRWLTDKGEESIHNFPLNADSVVVLIGGYKGDVTEELSKRFDCHIYVFEPVYEFFKILESRFSKNNKIKCFNYGCGESNRFQRISIDGTATSIYKPKTNDKNENVEVRRFDRDLLERLGIKTIDLMWLNAEGAEFEILPTVFDEGIVNSVNYFLIQFHTIYPDADNQRQLIRKNLQKTHKENWCYEFTWERWQRSDVSSDVNSDISTNVSGKKVLFIPDSIWGDLSGHRSSRYLVKAFNKVGVEVSVYASKVNHTKEQELQFGDSFTYFEQTEYSYRQNIFPSIIEREFLAIIDDFKPDYVFYMGTIKNKVTIDLCIKLGIPYSYLPLTTEYYCVKEHAGLEKGPCFQCMKAPILSPFKNRCLGARSAGSNFFHQYVKEIMFSIKSKPRILNANKIIGYSENQLKYLEKFGAKRPGMMTMPIFFDPETITGIESSSGDYFVMAGQNITAKGWHVLPDIIKKGKNIKYKLIMKSEEEANAFIQENELTEYLRNGVIEIILYLKTHTEFLEFIAKSRGVLVPSYYATTGEFYLLEALGLGKPVILFDSGIHSEVIKHEENGMISKIGDLDSFYKNIQKVNDDDGLYQRLSIGAIDLFDELLSFNRFKGSINQYFS